MEEKVSNFNKVNIITISRVFLSIIAVLLLFAGNIKLIAIAYAIMGFSEVSDVIDGYVARRDKLVTNLGKILDPLSDSVSRFFFYFAFAWHGLFPIWFMTFFFFRDIIVAYVRIYASFSGTVLSARISGKFKAFVQFAGQYLLIFALMFNTIQNGHYLNQTWINWIVGIALGSFILMFWIFKIRGFLLYAIMPLAFLLSWSLWNINEISFYVSYLTTFWIAFVVMAVTLYSLIDYLLSLEPKLGYKSRVFYSSLCIGFMFIISPYSLDLIKNQLESEKQHLDWKKYYDVAGTDHTTIRGIINVDKYLIVSGVNNLVNKTQLLVYEPEVTGIRLKTTLIINEGAINIKDMAYDGKYLYGIDDKINLIYKFDIKTDIEKEEPHIISTMHTGFTHSGTLTFCDFNNKKYLVVNDYLTSEKIYFFDLETTDFSKPLKSQNAFAINSEFYVKNLYFENGSLYVLVSKLFKDLIYKVNLEKAIVRGNLQDGIEKIIPSPDWNLQGISLFNNKIISYGQNSNFLYNADQP